MNFSRGVSLFYKLQLAAVNFVFRGQYEFLTFHKDQLNSSFLSPQAVQDNLKCTKTPQEKSFRGVLFMINSPSTAVLCASVPPSQPVFRALVIIISLSVSPCHRSHIDYVLCEFSPSFEKELPGKKLLPI